jgi:hypothetical protein
MEFMDSQYSHVLTVPAISGASGSKDYAVHTVDCGHIGIYVSRALKRTFEREIFPGSRSETNDSSSKAVHLEARKWCMSKRHLGVWCTLWRH